jgi:predicted NUDIX family phosphoesterase
MSVNIAVIPVETLRSRGWIHQGFYRADASVLAEMDPLIQPMWRPDAEQDTSVKQPIAYAIVRRGEEIFVTERLSGGVETRLHGVLSVGVGGHVDEPFAASDRVRDAMHREWKEEVRCSHEPEWSWLGLVNDDEIDVGKHHLGCVFEARIPSHATLELLETHKLRGWWTTPADLMKQPGRLETWSAFVVRALTGQ